MFSQKVCHDIKSNDLPEFNISCSSKENSVIFGGGIYRTPVSFLARQDLCHMEILLHKRSNTSSNGVFFVFCRYQIPCNWYYCYVFIACHERIMN